MDTARSKYSNLSLSRPNWLGTCALAILLMLVLLDRPLMGQKLSIQISSDKAYVDTPLVLTVTLRDASKFELPEIPDIPNCDFVQLGQPVRSSNVMVFNGIRTESSTTRVRYGITAKKPGNFTIPELTFVVDGRKIGTDPYEFRAVRSEVGDLMFVELTTETEQVYVGQSFDVMLEVGVQPYRDSKTGLELNGRNLFELVNVESESGYFQPDQNRNSGRSGATVEKVSRTNAQGKRKTYIVYRIPATVHTKRSGPITLDDVIVRCDYPTSIGKSRDPFDQIFTSPFRDQYVVSGTRPLVLRPNPKTVNVVPLPSEGKPAWFRGAIGEYEIVTRAEPNDVKADDPIELRMGIIGNGNMESLQAPRLAEIPELVKDFRVSEQPLPGFSRSREKIFITTIRPRRAGIKEIPALPFSFFNPDSETYNTVYSDPIPITVSEADTFALSSLATNPKEATEIEATNASRSRQRSPFENEYSEAALVMSDSGLAPSVSTSWWWYGIVLPPLAFGLVLVLIVFRWIWKQFGGFQSAQTQAKRRIQSATRFSELASAFCQFTNKRLRTDCNSWASVIGQLRLARVGAIADRLEHFFEAELNQDGMVSATHREQAESLLLELDAAIEAASKRSLSSESPWKRQVSAGLLIVLAWNTVLCGQVDFDSQPAMTQAQQRVLFQEANELYRQAMAMKGSSESVSAEAADAFREAASKYQLLIDSGIRTPDLFMNCANAYAQAEVLPRAIVNYLRVLRLSPAFPAARSNLRQVQSQLVKARTEATNASDGRFLAQLASIAAQLRIAVGSDVIGWTAAIVSMLFWSWLTLAVLRVIRWQGWALALGAALSLIGLILILSFSADDRLVDAVVTSEQIELRETDGDEANIVSSIDQSAGLMVNVIDQRGAWSEVRIRSGESGWIPSAKLEVVVLSD